MVIQCFILHSASHLLTRQIRAQHWYAGTHRRHHHRAVGGPGPGVFIPVQRSSHQSFGRTGLKTGCGSTLLRHLQRECGQLALRGQHFHHGLLDLLVRWRVVLFTQQQCVHRQQRLHFLRSLRRVNLSVRRRRRGDAGRRHGVA